MSRRAKTLQGTGLYLHASGYYYWRRVHPVTGRRVPRSTGCTRLDLALRKAKEWDDEFERAGVGLKTYACWKTELAPLVPIYIEWRRTEGGIAKVSLDDKEMRLNRALAELRLVRAADLDDVSRLHELVKALPFSAQKRRRGYQEPLRQFSGWLAGNGRVLDRDPLTNWTPIPFEPGEEKNRRALEPSELARALAAVSWLGVTREHLHPQDLLFRTLFVCASRVNALLSRNVENARWDESRLDLGKSPPKKPKGRAALDPKTKARLEQHAAGRAGSDPLLLGPHGTRQDQWRTRDLWRQALSLGFVDEFWPRDEPHDLRIAELVSRSLLGGGTVRVSAGGRTSDRMTDKRRERDALAARVQALVDRIGPTWSEKMEDLDVHGLRTTHHTWARALGVPPPCIDAQLGHAPGSGESLGVMRAVLSGSRTGVRHYLDMESKMFDAERSAKAVADRLDEELAAFTSAGGSMLATWAKGRSPGQPTSATA